MDLLGMGFCDTVRDPATREKILDENGNVQSVKFTIYACVEKIKTYNKEVKKKSQKELEEIKEKLRRHREIVGFFEQELKTFLQVVDGKISELQVVNANRYAGYTKAQHESVGENIEKLKNIKRIFSSVSNSPLVLGYNKTDALNELIKRMKSIKVIIEDLIALKQKSEDAFDTALEEISTSLKRIENIIQKEFSELWEQKDPAARRLGQ